MIVRTARFRYLHGRLVRDTASPLVVRRSRGRATAWPVACAICRGFDRQRRL